ncbi:thymidylate synthase (FAD) [Desulfitispora alkaliphila]|uniref:FAD-dependent thymidylate synthase n=1 Tax=Desulfitispora alkaliphila TaxID=622674 RepID=UPI003D1C3EDF
MGQVKLKVELIEHTPNPEELVATAAKLCYSGADIEELKQGVAKADQAPFIKKLLDMGHLSTVEHVSFTFGIEGVSRSLLAQITRHRIASFSVKSQRYVSETREDGAFNYIIPPEIEALGDKYVEIYREQMKTIQEWYNYWSEKLGSGGEGTNEDARFVLPNSAETKMVVTMNARELHHFFGLRCCNRAQWEIRALAEEMCLQVKKIAPNLFSQAGPACIAANCPEGKMSCGKQREMRAKYSI